MPLMTSISARASENSRDMHSSCGYNRTESHMAPAPSDPPYLAGSFTQHRKARGAGARICSAGFLGREGFANTAMQEVE